VRAVGVDFFIRALDGEIDLSDVDPEFDLRRAAEGMAVRTRFSTSSSLTPPPPACPRR
jgi:hypothetical protein